MPKNAPALTLTVRVGEKLGANGSIDRAPSGSVNFIETIIATHPGCRVYQSGIPLKKGYQSGTAAIKMPPEIGNITPFRYAEIVGGALKLSAKDVRQLMVHTAFDYDASAFQSSNETLNAVWELSKHTLNRRWT